MHYICLILLSSTISDYVLGLYYAYNNVDFGVPPMPTVLDRFVYTLKCETLPLVMVFFAIMVWKICIKYIYKEMVNKFE